MHFKELENNIEYLFAIALQKCENLEDAEDLTQEVLLAALKYTGDISNVKAWLSSVLNHKYYDMLRRKYKMPLVSIDLVAEQLSEDDESDGPEAPQVRREVAYLAEKYREVIVRHYLKGEKVQDIAEDLGLPKGTILSRLSYGREQMRKGLDDMERYEKQSYEPERLDLGCHGMPGLHDEPWSLIGDDMMKQNILIAAYEEPVTCVEIAHGLGIPTAYIEKAVESLVASELMHRKGNKVYTDFLITSPEQKLKYLDAEIKFAEEQYSIIWDFIKDYMNEIRNTVNKNAGMELPLTKLQYYFILHLLTTAFFNTAGRIVHTEDEFPLRPDGGRWIANGHRFPHNFDFDTYLYVKYCYGGERRAYLENFLNEASIHLHVYDTQPDLNKYMHGPVQLHDDNLCKLLYILYKEIPIENTGFNPLFLEDVPHLAGCGVLRLRDGRPEVDIPVLTKEMYRELDKIRVRKMHELEDILEPLFRELFPKLKLEIPNHLKGRIVEHRLYPCYEIPMAIMKKAIALGDFPESGATPPMVFAIEEISDSKQSD